MRMLLPLGLAFVLAEFAYYSTTLPTVPLRLRLDSNANLSALDNCIYQNGPKEFAKLERVSDNISWIGSGSRFGNRLGATYVAADGGVRITLRMIGFRTK